MACRRAVVELAGQGMTEAGRHWGSFRPKTVVDWVKGETGTAASAVAAPELAGVRVRCGHDVIK